MGDELLYLRARYYNPSMGVFPSLDPFEGMHSRPMSLNGYMYVEGDPVNKVDNSGKCAEVPYVNFLSNMLSQPTPCPMRESGGVDVLAFTAARESANIGSDLRNSDLTKAALMLMQVNAFRGPNQNGITELWTVLGEDRNAQNPQSAFINTASSVSDATSRERTLAGLFVEGHCKHSDPLFYFTPAASPAVYAAAQNEYPEIIANLASLQDLTAPSRYQNYVTGLRNEISIHGTRKADVEAAWGDSAYVVPPVLSGNGVGNRTVVITTPVNVNSVPLSWQCPDGYTVYLKDNPDNLAAQGIRRSDRAGHECSSTCDNPTWYLYLGENKADIESRIGTLTSENSSLTANYATVTDEQWRAIRRGSLEQPVIGDDRRDFRASCS